MAARAEVGGLAVMPRGPCTGVVAFQPQPFRSLWLSFKLSFLNPLYHSSQASEVQPGLRVG